MRKIKLMALLLAALMIVTAFAGCAGVKQEDLDAVNDRVSKIEDLLANQNDTIKDLADKVGEGSDNSEILDAIKDLKEDLEGKIEDVNNRVDEVENDSTVTPPTADETAAKKAALAEATASIEVLKATFANNKGQYDDDTYAAITKALATAQANVTSAETAEEIKAIVAELEKSLDVYKTYAMKLYDAYTALLGKLADDGAKDAVKAAKDLLEAVEEAYGKGFDDARKAEGDLYFYPADSTKGFDLYATVETLCEIYTKNSGYTVLYTVKYVNDKNKVVEISVPSLASVKKEAEKLDAKIKKDFPDDILFANLTTVEAALKTDLDAYETYVTYAEFVGGDALVKLITNADLLVSVQDKVNNLVDAKEAYGKLNGRVGSTYLTGLAPYKALGDNKVTLTFVDEDGVKVWTKDVYTQVAEDIKEWADEYSLSDKNVKAIIAAVDGSTAYADFQLHERAVKLIRDGYDKFVKSIVPRIEALNELSELSVEAVNEYNAIGQALVNIRVLQSKNANSSYDPDKTDIYLSNDIFGEYLEESGILLLDGVIENDTQELADRIATIAKRGVFYPAWNVKTADGATSNSGQIKARVLDMCNFEADIEQLGEDFVAERENGAIYKFFTVDYALANAQVTKINTQINRLADLVNKNKINSLEEILLLEGEYINLTKTKSPLLKAGEKYVAELGTQFTIGTSTHFVPAEKVLDYDILFQTALDAARPVFDPSAIKAEIAAAPAKKTALEAEKTELEAAKTALETEKATLDPTNDADKIAELDDKIAEKTAEIDKKTAEIAAQAALVGLNVDNTVTTSGVYVTLNGVDVLTIDFFKEAFPIFAGLVEADKLATAKAALETRIDELYKESNTIINAVNAIDYLRTPGSYGVSATMNIRIYTEANNNTTFNDVSSENAGSYLLYKNGVLESNRTAPTYAVSLAKAKQIDTVYDRYNKWVVDNGGNRYLTKLVAVTYSGTTTHADVFALSPVDNANKLENAIDLITDLKADIDALTANSKKVADYFAFAAEIKNLTFADVNNGIIYSTLPATDTDPAVKTKATVGDKVFAYTDYTETVITENGVAKVRAAYTYFKLDNNSNIVKYTQTGYVADDAAAAKALAYADLKDNALLTSNLLIKVVEVYDAFCAANVDYTCSGNKSTTELRFAFHGYAGDETVDTAEDAYADIDLVMTKAKLIAMIEAKTASASADVKAKVAELKGQVVNYVTDFSGLENAINNYNSAADDTTYDFTAADVATLFGVVIYNGFESLK